MKKTFLLNVALVCLVLSSYSKVLRVGFFGPPIGGVDYADLTAAITAAAANDTIYIFPGANSAGSYNISKRLVLMGYGNWLDGTSNPKGNANRQAFNGNSTLGTVVLLAGSAGTVITGMYGGTIYVGDCDNAVIRRNRNITINLGHPTSGPLVNDNVAILENYRVIVQSYSTNGYSATNLNISNNFINYISFSANNTLSGLISNNVWAYSYTETNAEINTGTYSIEAQGGSFLFQNNIFACYTNAAPASNYNYFVLNGVGNCIFNYNVMLAGYNLSAFPATGTGNTYVQANNAASLFEGFPTIGSRSADDRWVLKAGSPALVANRPGSSVDAGIYAGGTPYKLSTIPAMPTIYSLSSPQGNNPSGSTIQINLSTRGNN
jgi:hypothetical protein